MLNKDEIINDLIKKKPKGPDGVTLQYEVEETYSYDTNRFEKTYIPSIEGYGYTDDQMFSLSFTDRRDVEQYLRERDFEGKSDWSLGRTKSTLTRRTNNVWNKIQPAVKRVLSEGRPGIYEVKGDYGREEFGHIYATSVEEASQNAQIFFGYLHTRPLTVKFKMVGTVESLAEMNLNSQKRLEASMVETQNSLDRYQTLLENLNSRLSTLKIVEQQQIAVEMLHAVEDAANLKENSASNLEKDVE